MKPSECEICIDVPWWTDRAVAAGAFVVSFLVIFVCYVRQEAERHRNFYGKEDKLSDRERKEHMSEDERNRNDEMDAAALGESAGDVYVQKDTVLAQSPGDAKFRVMVPHRKKTATPVTLHFVPQMTPKKPVIVVTSPDSPYKLVLQVVVDKTGRAEELLDELKKEAVPHGLMTKVAETIVESVQEVLERMTRRQYMVVGVMLENNVKRSVIRGQEHFQEGAEELTLQMRLQLVQPYSVEIVAYQFETSAAEVPKVNPTPDVLPSAGVNKLTVAHEDEPPENIQTDVTPQQTPMKSMKPLSSRRNQKRHDSETPQSRRRPRLTNSGVASALSKNKTKETLDSAPVPPPPSSPVKVDSRQTTTVPSSNRKLSMMKTSLTKSPSVLKAKLLSVEKAMGSAHQQPGSVGSRMKARSRVGTKEKASSVIKKKVSLKEGLASTGEIRRKETPGLMEPLQAMEPAHAQQQALLAIKRVESQPRTDKGRIMKVKTSARSQVKTQPTALSTKRNNTLPTPKDDKM